MIHSVPTTSLYDSGRVFFSKNDIKKMEKEIFALEVDLTKPLFVGSTRTSQRMQTFLWEGSFPVVNLKNHVYQKEGNLQEQNGVSHTCSYIFCCKPQAIIRCPRCENTFYCSKVCKQIDHSVHKSKCLKNKLN